MLRIKILPTFLLVVPAAVGAAVACSNASAVEECRKSPGASAPSGSHWYYRINHVTHQQCWYIGTEGAHVSAHLDAGAGADGRAREAAPPHAPRDDAAAVVPAAAAAPRLPLQAQPAFMPVAGAGFVAPIPQAEFTARWPGDLPSASDLNDNAPTAASDSYAEPSASADATDAAAPAPQQWPVNDEASAAARKASPAAIVLGYFSLAGALAIPVLLIAGWLAKFVRVAGRFRLGNRLGDRRRTVTERSAQPRAPVAAAERAPPAAKARRSDPKRGSEAPARRSVEPREAAYVDPRYVDPRRADSSQPAYAELRGEPDTADRIDHADRTGRTDHADRTGHTVHTWRPLTPTDPARDLKTSLAELMRDLRRAAAGEDGSLAQPMGTPSGQHRRTLEAAE
jgi:hypothetical protein